MLFFDQLLFVFAHFQQIQKRIWKSLVYDVIQGNHEMLTKTYLYLTELFQKIKQDFPLTYRITNFLIVTEVENAKLVFKIISY